MANFEQLAADAPRSGGKGCGRGCALVLVALLPLGILAALLANGIFGTMSSPFPSGPSGKLLGATVVADGQGRDVLWMLVDEGFYVFTTVSRPGYKSSGNRCYLFCYSTVFALDLKSGDVLLRDTLENSGSPGNKAALAAVGSDVWAVIEAKDDRGPAVRLYDAVSITAQRDTAAFVASEEKLSAGLVNAKLKGSSVELSTKDGRTVSIPMSTEAGSDADKPSLPFFLIAESRANKARMKLCKLGGTDVGDHFRRNSLLSSIGLGHGTTLEKVQRKLDRHLSRKADQEKRKKDRRLKKLKYKQKRRDMLRKRIEGMRKAAAKVGRRRSSLRKSFNKRADKLQAQVDKADAEAASAAAAEAEQSAPMADEGDEDKQDPRIEALADERVFLEAWVVAQDAEYIFIVHQQVAGKRSGRLLSCVDSEGALRWTLQPEQLPEVLVRDDVDKPFSGTSFVKTRMALERHGDAVVLAMRPDEVRVYDLATGEQRLVLEL